MGIPGNRLWDKESHAEDLLRSTLGRYTCKKWGRRDGTQRETDSLCSCNVKALAYSVRCCGIGMGLQRGPRTEALGHPSVPMYQPVRVQPWARAGQCLWPRKIPREGCRYEPTGGRWVDLSGPLPHPLHCVWGWRQLLIRWLRTSKALNTEMIRYDILSWWERLKRVKSDAKRHLKKFKLYPL